MNLGGGGKPPPPVCTEIEPCAALCKDGAGNLDACVRLGELALAGRKSAPDARRALTAFRVTCGLDDKWIPIPERTATADPRGCLQAAELLDRGWLFDVEKDPTRARGVLDRAIELGKQRCTDADPSRCEVAARAIVTRDRKLPLAKADILGRVALAERGCKARQTGACRTLTDTSWTFDAVPSMKPEAKRLRSVADAGLTQACITDGDVAACLTMRYRVDGISHAEVKATIERRCKEGDKQACATVQYELLVKERSDPTKQLAASKQLVALCVEEGHSLCSGIAETLLSGARGKTFTLPVDPSAGLALASHRCELGEIDGCRVAAMAYGVKGPVEAIRDATKARAFADRSCMLQRPDWTCGECRDYPTLPSCTKREAFREHNQCLDNQPGACERIAKRFESGTGVEGSLDRAADYLRRGCDAAERGACVALDDLCIRNPSLPAKVCQQALIHSDLFYEAEYQLDAGNSVDLVDSTKTDKAKAPSVTVGSVVAQTPTQYRRGHLDADLVVDVVLDRVRQAAIGLVVDQLLTAERRARYRYLRDLLEQGAGLLADPSTLRREKFQDLGMIVVRAFVAANLIEGLFPTGKELMAAPEIGATVARDPKGLGVADDKELPAAVHGYLVDVTYYWLGETRVFGNPTREKARSLECPWPTGQGAILCTQLAERATAERILGIDRMLDGMRLAKALREGGFDDLRRLIEASSRSRTIADFGSTPGLQLRQWRTVFVDGTRTRLENLRLGIEAMRRLSHREAFAAEGGLDLPALAQRAQAIDEALKTQAVKLSLGNETTTQLRRMAWMITRASEDLEGSSRPVLTAEPAATEEVGVAISVGPVEAPAGGAKAKDKPKKDKKPAKDARPLLPVIALDARGLILQKLRQDVGTVFAAWTARDLEDLDKRLDAIAARLDTVLPVADRLEKSIAELTALFSRFPNADGSPTLDVANLPLYATPDLTRELDGTTRALVDLDDALRALFPGEVQAQLRFARSATIRLRGFLDLMERVARSSQLTMRTGEVIAALRTLGTYRTGVFDAPLYDVLDPVLDSIKTHEPMTLELLYTVIAHVRLDTLITRLQGRGSACKDESSVDCWTTRLVHALQESVERDGDTLRIDGGKFATRLAQHGDDFRRRHKWRGFLHLTVGVGALYSDPVGDAGSERRSVPLISEQIGVGLASPSFAKNSLTFKIGAAASGLLYRAVVDSEESNAIMVHPLFFAMDIGNLVEIYVSPATLMLYPPTDMHDTAFRWAATAGIQVPLSAYLERL